MEAIVGIVAGGANVTAEDRFVGRDVSCVRIEEVCQTGVAPLDHHTVDQIERAFAVADRYVVCLSLLATLRSAGHQNLRSALRSDQAVLKEFVRRLPVCSVSTAWGVIIYMDDHLRRGKGHGESHAKNER